MRLREFQGNAARTPTALATSLQSYLGKLVKVGGASRFYNIGEGPEVGVVYLIDGTEKAFAFSWERDLAAAGVTKVYVWNRFNINNVPDFELDIPVTAEMDELVPALVKWIKSPKLGEISEGKLTEARRTTDAEFLQMAQAEFPGTCDNLTWPEIMQVANKNDVQVPGSIRGNVSLKVDAHHWNLSGGTKSSTEHDDAKIAQSLGGELEEPTAQDDEETRNLVNLAKVKTLKKLAGAGRLYLQGKKANGKFFKIPGIEEILVMIERAMTRNLENGIDGDRLTMEQQYEMLREKVTIVAGGKAAFVKSLLITGAPSSGKTFAVMQTIIKELGLEPGRDFVIKKGSITPLAMYRTLIEQIDGLIIFDDCDSVIKYPNGINMLKGALDTDPIREVSNDSRGSMNTATMDVGHRNEVIDAISRILRNQPETGDLERFRHFLKKKKEKKPPKDEPKDYGDEEDDDDNFDMGDDLDGIDELDDEYERLLHDVQQYLLYHLPNLIDFRGRIIFISNMDESEWDSAILTRAMTVNMKFTSGEMLDYIDNIKSHLKTPNVDDEQKQEVMDYLRELYISGKLRRDVNFRLVQQAFDLRLSSNWKRMIALL